MKTSDFYYDLPQELIAQHPLAQRTDSRLLVYHRSSKTPIHSYFRELGHFLRPGDLLVFNNSQVIPARIYGHKISGGRVEFLVERLINREEFWAHMKASKSPKVGARIIMDGGWEIEILAKEGGLVHARASGSVEDMLECIGQIPLPSYIHRDSESSDHLRYQTVYAKYKGSVAAPTAGLHFDEAILEKLRLQGIEFAYVTLHVGAGTFQPVRREEIADHKMHSEWFSVSQHLCDQVRAAKDKGGRVIAVGTTAMRSLESAAEQGQLSACHRDTAIFIKPGYQFKVCDGLITNFHVPESTLLMLVSALIGYPETMSLYQEAIMNNYRFLSYGDANLLL